MQEKKFKIIFKIVSIVLTVALIAFVIYALKLQIFSSNKELIIYIRKFGILAPLIFIFIQIIQVVFPIIPGGASCLAGTLAFGGFWGFIYNYVGLCMGSTIVFFLARQYGMFLISKIFKKELIQKYIGYIKSSKFDMIFFWIILVPGFPDDLFCYLAGLSSIKTKKFIGIILLAKPLSLLMYSIFVDYFPLFMK